MTVDVSPQSSQVLSFTPAPTGEDGCSDLISVVKRFGEPLYTLFLPSKVSVSFFTVFLPLNQFFIIIYLFNFSFFVVLDKKC